MRTILHIGLHKTGTTSLQAFLHKNAAVLAKHGVLYRTPAPDRPDHHWLLGWLSTAESRKGAIAYLQALSEEAKSYESVLISSEMMCDPKFDVAPILEMVPRPITAIAYLRCPEDRLVSSYNHQVRNSHFRRVAPISKAVVRACKTPAYAKALARWMSAVEVQLILAPYDPPQWKGGTLFTDFLAVLGIDDPSDFDHAIGKLNDAWPESVIEILRLVNRLPISEEQHARLVGDLESFWRANPERFLRFDLLTEEERKALRANVTAALPMLRPYYRDGFDERFLIEPLQ
jgi:hypothetical protein